MRRLYDKSTTEQGGGEESEGEEPVLDDISVRDTSTAAIEDEHPFSRDHPDVLVLCYIRDRDEDDLSRAIHDVPEVRVEHVWRIHFVSDHVTHLRAFIRQPCASGYAASSDAMVCARRCSRTMKAHGVLAHIR